MCNLYNINIYSNVEIDSSYIIYIHIFIYKFIYK